MLHNSIDMKVYALQTKTEIHREFSNGILRNFRADSFENNFGGLFLKQNRGGERRAVTLVVSGFHFFQDSYLFIKP